MSLLFKNVKNLFNLKTFTRYRRIQSRKPLAVYEDFNEAYDRKVKFQQDKELRRKMPKPEEAKNAAKRRKIPQVKFQTKEEIQKEKQIFLKLQMEANKVYTKHDPFMKDEVISKEAIRDIEQNVDYLAAKLSNKNDGILSSILRLTDGDHRFGPQIQIAKSKLHRYEKRKILLEGKRLIVDALDANIIIESFYLANDKLIKEFDFDFSKLNYSIKLFQVSPRSISLWSDVETSQGFIAIAKMPSAGDCKIKRTLNLPFVLVLDQVRDPGNMGTIIRTAAACGCARILITKGSVDIWDPKVIRSAMGAHFRIPILNNLSPEQVLSYLPVDTHVLLADNNKKANESIDYSNLNEINPSNKHTTLIIGNETMGISTQIKSLIGSMIKVRTFVNIPLENGIESLNASIAFSILSYEIRKLLLKK